jgi:hypothetical protein
LGYCRYWGSDNSAENSRKIWSAFIVRDGHLHTKPFAEIGTK